MWFQERISIFPTLFLYVSIVTGPGSVAQEPDGHVAMKAPIFTAVSPKIVSSSSVYSIFVNVESSGTPGAGSPLGFKASIGLRGAKEPLFSSLEQIQVQPGDSGLVSIPVQHLPEENSTFQLTLYGLREPKVMFKESTDIFKDATKSKSLLLQTDKPIYKPGETVQFRVIAFNRLLRPPQDHQTVTITVLDPQQNIIKQWNRQPLGDKGLLSSKLELSSEPNLGDWTIRVRLDSDSTKKIHFRVDEYVLPKFRVTIRLLPTYLTYNSSRMLVEIQAEYTYGKSVHGSAQITLSEIGRQPKSVVKKVSVQVNGSAFVEFDVAKELELDTRERELAVDVSVTDAITGRMQNTSSRIKIYEHEHKIQVVQQPANWKPGFPLELLFKVSKQDGTPVSDNSPNALKLAHGFAFNEQDGILYFPIPATGLVKVALEMPTNPLMPFTPIQVRYEGVVAKVHPPPKLVSPSGTYVELTLLTQTRSMLEVNVRLSKPFEGLNYLLLHGRGQVLTSAHVPTNGPVEEFNFSVPITQAAAAPEARVLVYAVVKPGNHIVADSKTFKIGAMLDNHLTLGLSTPRAEPNEKIDLSVGTLSGSLVALRGVDQSVTLLSQDRDITTETIEKEIKGFQEQQFSSPRFGGGAHSLQLFDQAGVVVLTNGVLEPAELQRPGTSTRCRRLAIKTGGCNVLRSKYGSGGGSGGVRRSFRRKTAGPPTQNFGRVRTHFPETFLWTEFEANSSLTTLPLLVPDTLTSWLITGFSLHTNFGIGVSLAPTVLESFQSFFITLNLPYAIVYGETVGVEVLVHNYMQQKSADISLLNNNNDFIFNELDDENAAMATKRIQIEPNSVQLVTFTITPTKFGIIKLNVRGVAGGGLAMAGDALSQALIVKPPGQKYTQTRTTLLDLSASRQASYQLQPEYPANTPRVQGADVVKVSIVADLLGPTISNLDKLLEMPTGCGEQNMLNFVPDVLVLDYLHTLGQLTPQIRAKAVRFLETGYQQQLTYKHEDGSFSAFGSKDKVGSTWLTAFVVRSFMAAKPWITIDAHVLKEALKFLAGKQQGEDGRFVELGKVVHSEMQGGTAAGGGGNQSIALSAYVLLAFIEARDRNLTITAAPEGSEESGESTLNYNMDVIIANGLDYLASSFNVYKDDTYSMNLITYTRTVAGRPDAENFVQVLEQLAHKDKDTEHWEPALNGPSTKPISIEMSSYGLMTFLARNELDKALAIGRWLLQQRNSQGGFLSTQDTVVGLAALAKFALATRSPVANDLSIRAIYEGGAETFVVNDGNSIVLQELFLPANVRGVNLEVEGQGTALATLSWSYYVDGCPMDAEAADPSFTISIQARAVTPNGETIQVSISAAFLRPKQSNMAVMEINLPSGYVFDRDQLLPALGEAKGVMRHELEDGGTKLQVYFDHLTSIPTTIDLRANRLFKVENPAKAYVKVYDYYDTTLTTTEFYETLVAPAANTTLRSSN